MSTLTPAQVEASLKRASREAARASVSSLRIVAERALKQIDASWPVLTGTSQQGWISAPTMDGAEVLNDVDYTSYVHEGLESTLIPEVLAGLEDDWAKILSSTLTPILERG